MLKSIWLNLRLWRLKRQKEELEWEIIDQQWMSQELHPESLELDIRERQIDLLRRQLAAIEAEIQKISRRLRRT